MDIKQEVLDIVCEYVDIPQNEIDTTQGLKFSAGMDSFVLMSMIANIEEHFNIRIPAEQIGELKTLDDIIGLIAKMV